MKSCVASLRLAVACYRDLRQAARTGDFVGKTRVESHAVQYLEQTAARNSSPQ
jgi:hypothetical protein